MKTLPRLVEPALVNPLRMRQVSESLAGRASYLTLWPMTRREQAGEGRAGRWEDLLIGLDESGGGHLENLVLHDLLAWRDAQPERAEIEYCRTASGERRGSGPRDRGRRAPAPDRD